MNVHLLKIRPEFYDEVVNRTKKTEIRYNDRNYCIGDILILWLYADNEHKKSFAICRITHILDDVRYMKEGFVALSITLLMSGRI